MGGEGVARDARMAKRHSVRTALVGESLTPTTRATSVFQTLVALWRRNAATEPSGAAGWAAKVLHGTHGVRRGISVRKAADRRWRSRADETLTGAPNERRNAVRAPKTPSRPSPCGATPFSQQPLHRHNRIEVSFCFNNWRKMPFIYKRSPYRNI